MIDEKLIKEKYDEAGSNLILETISKLKDNAKISTFAYAIEVASLVVGLKLDSKSVCAALIFSARIQEDLDVTKFATDKEVLDLVEKCERCDKFSKNYTDPEGLKEMLIAISKEIRVIIIKIAEVLIYARQNVGSKTDSAKETFKSIVDIFAPIAARLGLSEIKSELQDLALKFNKPEEYKALENAVKLETRANSQMISDVVEKLKMLLAKNGIDCKSYGRVKHLSSIYNKLVSKNCTLKNIYDISAVRILVSNVSECYAALGIVHANFVPVDGRFKDYIANPKPNGYQSLHTTVYYNNEFFEIQIRTFEMHDFAEYGVAAHFLYKEHQKSLSTIDNRLLWIRKLIESKEESSADSLIEELKTDVYLGEIFVRTPKGKVIKMTENATPVDFAYLVHSDIGNSCVGAKVNGSIVPIFSTLENGDVVEIITSANSKGPSKDWLKRVKMQNTKDKINSFFKKQMKEENIKLGKAILESYAKSNEIQLSELLQEKYVLPILKKNTFSSIEEVYASIGYGSITAEKFISRLMSLKISDDKKNKPIFDGNKIPLKVESNSEIIGAEGTLTKFCKCCNPIPGDNIIGYVSRGRGIIIHKDTCESVSRLQQSRFINVAWNVDSERDYTFTSIIDVVAKNSSNIFLEITNAINEVKVKVASLNSNQSKNGELTIKVGVLVKDKNQLQVVKNKLAALQSVYEVK